MRVMQDPRLLRNRRTGAAIVMTACSVGFATSVVSAATVSAVATGTLVSATLDSGSGATSIDNSTFTWTIEFDDSAFTNIGGTNYWNSISKSEMVIDGVGTVTNLGITQLSPLGNTFRTYVGSAGFSGFQFASTPISGTNWTNATTGNFGAWDAAITSSYNISPKTFTTNLGTLVISDSDFSSFISGASAVPGGGIAAIATLGLAGVARRRR